LLLAESGLTPTLLPSSSLLDDVVGTFGPDEGLEAALISGEVAVSHRLEVNSE
jgi:hypothetical protein